MTAYIVLNENTLGYIITPMRVGVLAGSVLRCGHHWFNGPVSIVPSVDKIRPATQADFEVYRVSSVGHLNKEIS